MLFILRERAYGGYSVGLGRQKPSDDDLMRSVQAGDVDAFEALVSRYRAPLEVFLAQMLGDRDLAQDFAQEAFLRVYQEASEYIPMGRFRGWVYTIARNSCLNSIGSAKRHRALTPDAPLILWNWQKVATVPTDTEDERRIALRKETELAAARLPERQRRSVLLKYVHGLSISEIADVEDCPEGTVKSRLHYALRRLREKLAPTFFKEHDEST